MLKKHYFYTVQFSAVFGQEELKRHLIQEVRSDKISHAQLFLGKMGHGSLPLALAFITYIFCENKSEKDSCGICANCKKNAELQHPDVHFSFPAVQAIAKTSNAFLTDWRKQVLDQPFFDLNDWTKRIDVKERKPIIGTDESLEIVKKLALKSYEGGYKVMLIWKAEEMNTTSANKLLKTIEEPPANTILLLIAEHQEQILPTILSRAQLIRVPNLSTDLIQKAVEDTGLTRSQAESIAARSDGDMIAALRLIGDHEELDLHRDLFIQLMRVCFKKDVNEMLNWADAVSGLSREGQKLFLQYALYMVRQSILQNYTQGVLSRTSEEEADFLKNFSRFINNNNALDFMQLFNDSHYQIERNAFGKLLFTQLCFQVMRFIHKA